MEVVPELRERARSSAAAFRCLSVQEKQAIFEPLSRPGDLPSLVEYYDSGPTEVVFRAALQDRDEGVRVVAAMNAPLWLLRTVMDIRWAQTSGFWWDLGYRWGAAPGENADRPEGVVACWLGSAPPERRAIAAAAHGSDFLERLGATKDQRDFASEAELRERNSRKAWQRADTPEIVQQDIREALTWGAPWPLVLVGRHPNCPPDLRLRAVRKLMTELGPGGGAVKLTGRETVLEVLRTAASAVGHSEVCEALDEWALTKASGTAEA